MSYSFSIKAASKAEAKEQITKAFDGVVANQVTHKDDRDAAIAAGHAFVDLLADPKDGDEITVSMNGSLSWLDEGVYTASSVSISARVATKSPLGA